MRTTEFKDTELGPIPKDWEVKRVGEIASVTTGNRNTQDAVAGGLYPFYVRSSVVERINDYSFDTTGVVTAGDGVGTGKIFHFAEGKFGLHQRAYLIYDFNNVDARFFYWMFSQNFYSRIMQMTAKSSVDSVRRVMITEMDMAFPPLPEQRRIAAALGDVDKLIENLKKRVEKKKNLKRGAMQELLTGKRRLKGFTGTWVELQLGKIGAFYGGLSGKSSKDFGVGDSRFITFLNVLSNVVIDRRMLGVVSIQQCEKQNLVQKGDLFFNGSSETPEEVAMCAALLEDLPNTYLNSFCCGFRLFDQQQDPLFISYFFNSEAGREVVKTCAQGLTRYNLSKETFLKQSMKWPKLSEQRAIAAVLSDMDAEIANLEAKLKKMTLLKQGMMQDLQTGKVRLV